MDTPLQVAWSIGMRVCTSFPRSQLSDGLKAQDQYDPISTVSLAMCEGTGSGRAAGGRCYNHLRMGGGVGGRRRLKVGVPEQETFGDQERVRSGGRRQEENRG